MVHSEYEEKYCQDPLTKFRNSLDETIVSLFRKEKRVVMGDESSYRRI
jgi:hypothetical protein